MIYFFTGIIASAFHVITGPDHLAAVAPLAIESKNKAWHIGFFWGVGHITGMLLIGLLFILLKELIPVEAISGHSEQLVGIVLILIGIWAIFKALRKNKHSHSHPHIHLDPKPQIHIHEHIHDTDHVHQHEHTKTYKQNNLTAFLIGTLHGFAGISHVILLLPTLAFPTIFDSVMYLVGFGIGTIAAMIAFALFLGLISLKSASHKKKNVFLGLRIGGGIFAIFIGIFWIIQTF